MRKCNWITPEWPAPVNVKAISTLREGGFSLPPYEGLNLGAFVEDQSLAVEQNRQLLKESANLPSDPVWLKQVHGTEVIDLNSIVHLNPSKNEIIDSYPVADASFTFKANQLCTVTTADCLPILVCDQKGTRVAAIHAGWRGLAAGVIESTIANLNSPGNQLMAWLGPALGPKVFEVGEEVLTLFNKEGDDSGFTPFGEKWKLDIYKVASSRLKRLGITQIFGGDFCTYTDHTRFFSYRRASQAGTQTGRMATIIWLMD